MLNKIQEYKEYIKTHVSKRTLTFVLGTVILAVLAFTVIIAQNRQTIRQRASELVSPSSPPFPPVVGFGKAVSLAGTEKANFQYFSIPSNSSFDASANYTIEAWVKPSSKPFSPGQKILNKASDSSKSYSLSLNVWDPVNFRLPSGSYGYFYNFAVADKTNSNCAYREANQATVETSEQDITSWQHVAGVINNGKISLYVNGKEVNYFPANGIRTVSSFCNSTNPLQIGSYPGADPNFPQIFPFNGQVDEVRISNTARYSSNFSPPITPFASDANTVALYHFDGDTQDASGNGNNGQINGNVQFVDSTIGSPALTPTPIPSTPTSSPTPISRVTLFVSPMTISIGGTMNFTWSGVPNAAIGDYIFVYNANGEKQDSPRFWTNNCFKLSSDPPKASGTCSNMPTPSSLGTYYMILYSNIDNAVLAKSNNFTISTPIPTPNPIANLCTACSADINKSGVVNTQDITIVNTCIKKKGRSGTCKYADVNKDGKIDGADFNCVLKNNGKKC